MYSNKVRLLLLFIIVVVGKSNFVLNDKFYGCDEVGESARAALARIRCFQRMDETGPAFQEIGTLIICEWAMNGILRNRRPLNPWHSFMVS